VDFEDSPDSRRTIICKSNAGRCGKNKDIHPYPNVLIVDIDVADLDSEWITPEQIVARAKAVGLPIPSVSHVELRGTAAAKRTCWVARALEYGDLWLETYGLIVDSHRFKIRVFYNNESANIEPFRSAVIDILSSLALTGQKN